MDNPEFKIISEAISQTTASEDYEIKGELNQEISQLVYEYIRKKSERDLYRKHANKKRRNKLADRITKNAEKLSRDMWQVLRTQVLNAEILKQYTEVKKESSHSKTLSYLMPSMPSMPVDSEFDHAYLPINEMRDLNDIFSLITQLKILSEAATRTNKDGLGLSTNIETGLPELSESINRLLMEIVNSDDNDILKSERAGIIFEIFDSVGIDGGSSLSIMKNIS